MLIAIPWLLLPFACIAAAQQDVAHQIQELPSPSHAQALGAQLLQQSRTPAAAAAVVWQTGDPSARRNARTVLNEMEEASLDPLLHAKGALDPIEQVWRMTTVVETLGDLRKSAATMLDSLLVDKRPALLANMDRGEGRAPFRRVCDEAYVQMSSLTATDPHTEDFLRRIREA